VFLLCLFGWVGYIMRRYGYPVAGATIAVILGRGLESNLRGGLVLAGGWGRFLTRPWVMIILTCAFGLLFYAAWGTYKMAKRDAAIRRRLVALAQKSA
jgi:putative tricarboxylic transport membrane protein